MNRLVRAILAGSLALLLVSLAWAQWGPRAEAIRVFPATPGFTGPRAVAATADRVFSLDGTGHFYAFDPDGGLLDRSRLVKTARGFPVGVTVESPRTLLVADTHEARVLRLSHSGEKLETIAGGYGSLPGQFVYPQRIAVADGLVFVTEYGFDVNNRVQVFTATGEFVRTFGKYGKEGGAFARPCGIVVGPGDRVYVADASHRILVWTRTGEFLRDFAGQGTEPGRLRYPYGLAADEQWLYVVEYGNNRISRFSREGEFAGTFGELGTEPGQFKTPRDLALFGGFLYVADTGNDRIVRLRIDGLTWRFDR